MYYCSNKVNTVWHQVIVRWHQLTLILNKLSVYLICRYHVLELSDGFHDLGGLRWQLVCCMIAAWFLLFLCLVKGVKSLGKVVYLTSLLPYVLLTILLIRSCLLPGSLDGIRYYIIPDFQKLLKPSVSTIWSNLNLQNNTSTS